MPKGHQMERSVKGRWVVGSLGATALFAAIAGSTTSADARDRALAAGVIGGMSAGAILGTPYYPGYGYGYYPGYPAPVYHVAPLGPPPGCVIKQQKVWDGYGWRWRKLRICH
jgi:hypothetical protein